MRAIQYFFKEEGSIELRACLAPDCSLFPIAHVYKCTAAVDHSFSAPWLRLKANIKFYRKNARIRIIFLILIDFR